MRRVGLLGGLSWVSTLEYYKYVNEGVNERLGGLNYAECVVDSVNFDDIQRKGWDDWENTFRVLSGGCARLKAAGCEAIVLCANTAHAVADRLEAEIGLPIIHIAIATAAEIERRRLRTVGLLGTKFTMELPFYRDKLRSRGIETIVPAESQTREFVQATLRNELGRGIALASTRRTYLDIIDGLIDRGAEGIVFGCTELPLLLGESDVAVPVFDTTRIHARAAVDFALSG